MGMSAVECGEHFNKTGKIPPVNLVTWVSVYSIITSCGIVPPCNSIVEGGDA